MVYLKNYSCLNTYGNKHIKYFTQLLFDTFIK